VSSYFFFSNSQFNLTIGFYSIAKGSYHFFGCDVVDSLVSPDSWDAGVSWGSCVVSNSFHSFYKDTCRTEQSVSCALMHSQVILDSILLVCEVEGNTVCMFKLGISVA
jgi:hypothetical protein